MWYGMSYFQNYYSIPNPIPLHFMKSLHWHWDRFVSEYLGFPLSLPFHQRYTFIIVLKLRLPEQINGISDTGE